MRVPLVAGNWKLNKTAAEARTLISELLPGLAAVENVDSLVCPPYLAIPAAAELLRRHQSGSGRPECLLGNGRRFHR